MKRLLRTTVYVLSFVVPIALLGTFGAFSSVSVLMSRPTDTTIPITDAALHTKSFDPAKPTVAIVLGSDFTENTDFLIPYEIFSAAEAYNVYGVASERKMRTLTGGLDVLPDFTFAELDAMPGKSPDIVVLPAMTEIAGVQNQPLLAWVKQKADEGALVFSICAGAEVFAATGLLDGRTATTHWADIDRLQQKYPAVKWVRGVRYVDGDSYMTSAGITSGIDAALRLIARRQGDKVAQAIAQKLHYPGYGYVDNPQAQQIYIEPSMSIYLLNFVFRWDHATAGVLLYDGVGELELASVFDTNASSFSTKLFSISPTRRLITTQHGLQLVPRRDYSDASSMDRLLVPGNQASQLATSEVSAWQTNGNAAKVVYIHPSNKFSFDATLQDLAHQQNIPTAEMAAKFLEYRPGMVQLEGTGWPLWLVIRTLLVGVISVFAVRMYMKLRHKTAIA